MADDDLPTRLHWPVDPLDKDGVARTSDASPARSASGADDAPQLVLGERNDVARLRQEVADLRHAIDQLADRVQLRQLRASLDELRSEMISLRRAVVESPELGQLSAEVTALRSHLIDVQQSPAPAPTDPLLMDAIADVHATVTALGNVRTPVAALAPIVEELAALRDEVASLRRRISLRGGQGGEPALDDAQLERLVATVVERVLASSAPAASRRRR